MPSIDQLTPEQRAQYINAIGRAPGHGNVNGIPQPQRSPGIGDLDSDEPTNSPKFDSGALRNLIQQYITRVRANPGGREQYSTLLRQALDSKVGEFRTALSTWMEGHRQGLTDANQNGIPDSQEVGARQPGSPAPGNPGSMYNQPPQRQMSDNDGSDFRSALQNSMNRFGSFPRVSSLFQRLQSIANGGSSGGGMQTR